MTALKSALVQSGVVNIPEILKKEFFNCIRLDKELRSVFNGKSPDGEKRRNSYSDIFNSWMHKYNEWRKTANKWVIPEHKMPTELIDCAEVFGYKGKKEFLPAWEYIQYLLQEEWISGFVDDSEHEPSLRELTLSTLALIQGIMKFDKNTSANELRELQIKQLLTALWLERRRLWTSKDKVAVMIQKAMDEAKKWDELKWNQEDIVRIARTIMSTIR